MEDLSNLDSSMFTRHPDGYICRCGLPDHCACPTDFPEAVVADLSARIRELEEAIERHRLRKAEPRCTPMPGHELKYGCWDHDMRLWSVIEDR